VVGVGWDDVMEQPYLLQDDLVKLVVLNQPSDLNAFDTDSLVKLSLSFNVRPRSQPPLPHSWD